MNNSCLVMMQGIIKTIADFGFRFGEFILIMMTEIISYFSYKERIKL